jgi:hypothetical protein
MGIIRTEENSLRDLNVAFKITNVYDYINILYKNRQKSSTIIKIRMQVQLEER